MSVPRPTTDYCAPPFAQTEIDSARSLSLSPHTMSTLYRTLPLRALLRTTTAPHRATTCFSTSSHSLSSSSDNDKSQFSRPGPPLLDRAQQKEFEELQRRVNTPASKPLDGFLQQPEQEASGNDVEMHPDYRRAPEPTFEGETNPVTGEVGGPKREPLTHGE